MTCYLPGYGAGLQYRQDLELQAEGGEYQVP